MEGSTSRKRQERTPPHLPRPLGAACRVHRRGCLRKLLLAKTVARKAVTREHGSFLRDGFLCSRGEAPFVGAGTLFPSTAAAGFSHGFQLRLADSPLPPHHGYRALHKMPAVASLFCSSPRSRRRCAPSASDTRSNSERKETWTFCGGSSTHKFMWGTSPFSCAKFSETHSAWHRRSAECDAKYGRGPSAFSATCCSSPSSWAPSSAARTPSPCSARQAAKSCLLPCPSGGGTVGAPPALPVVTPPKVPQ